MRNIVLLLGGILWLSCSDPANNRHTAASSAEASVNSSSGDAVSVLVLDTNNASVRALKKIFRIEKERGNGIYLQAYIYISDTSKLVAINGYLRVRYWPRFTEALDIWYFDKPHMVNNYLSAMDDHTVSDKEFDRLDRHMVCQYSQLRKGEGTLDWNKP